MRIGIIQTNCGPDMQTNIAHIERLLGELEKKGGAEFVITPECSNILGYHPAHHRLFDEASDPLITFSRDWARAHSSYFCLGSAILAEDEGKAVNRQILIDPEGKIISRYDKIHMFDVDLPGGESHRESDRICAGNQAETSAIEGITLGHSICFDLRFGALYRQLARNGAEALLIPAAFTRITGQAHWEVLLRARAIETGSFVIAPAGCGDHIMEGGSKRSLWGHSMVISPWGKIIAQMGDEPGVLTININREEVALMRAQIPVFKLEREFDRPARAKPARAS